MVEDIEFEPRMSDSDALMWSIEKDPLLRSTITAVFVLDRSPDRSVFRRRIDRVSRVVPRLRQRVLGHPFSIAPPRWAVDPNFDLDYHVRWMRTVDQGTLREVFDIAEPITMQGFDRARPLWEFTVVDGLEGGRAAVIAKIHHSITDGVGGIKLMMELLDVERQPATEPELPPAPEPERLPEAKRMVDALAYEGTRQLQRMVKLAGGLVRDVGRLTTDPVGLGLGALRTAASVGRLVMPATEPLSPLMRDRSLSVRFDSLQLDVGKMKQAARMVSGRLNDAFVAGVAGGFHRYHQKHGATADRLRMTMPINVRTATTANKAGNQFVPARFAVPVGIDDPIARLTAIRELVQRTRAEPALSLTDELASVLNRLPTTVTTNLFGAMLKGVDCITSNVPGAPMPVYLAGSRIVGHYAFGPMTGSAANVVLLSYCGDCNLGINTDPAAIPDADTFVACLHDSFDELFELAD
jgi:diacylglycerol O-acyltransferase / wax synthase